MIRTFYDPGFAAPIGKHIMPMSKFSLVAQALRSDPAIQLVSPRPIEESEILQVHTPHYLQAIRTGEPRSLAESQKFPWSPELYPSVVLTNGAARDAAREALQSGSAAALVSGFHHSHKERGEGFCTFNGLIIALESLKKAGLIKTAAILDMDLHYGNGTAILAQERPWIKALSLYGNDYWNNVPFRDVSVRQHEDGPNHKSYPLPAGCDRSRLLEIMEMNLPFLLEGHLESNPKFIQKPDILLYQAGADPYYEDPYSPLSLNHEDLLERDRRVFQFARQAAIPIAWVLAGGYTADISKVVQVHTNTFEAWKDVYKSQAH